MKNTIISNIKLKEIGLLFLLTSLLFYSCSPEEEPTPIQSETDIEEVLFTPKVLATIKIDNDIDLIFKSEEDGVVLEASGDTEHFNGLGTLKDLSTLEIFLALTKENVEVPNDLLVIEEDPKIKAKANQRKSIEKHSAVLISKTPQVLQKFEGSYCVGSANYGTYNQSGNYYRIYNNYKAGSAGTTLYSSGKPGGTKCKRVELEITNCNSSSTLRVRTYYKNVFGNYKTKKTLHVSPLTCRIYRKTFASKRYRKTSVTSLSGNTNHRFGGYLLYTKY